MIAKHQDKINTNIKKSLTELKERLKNSDDVVFRSIEINNQLKTKAFICYISGLTDAAILNENVIKPLTQNDASKIYNDARPVNVYGIIRNHILSIVDLSEEQSMSKVVEEILSAKTALFIENYSKVFIINAQAFELRNVEEPSSETVVRGPREGFTESIDINISLVRRKIKNPDLTFKRITLGRQTNTTIYIAYIDGIANPRIVQEVNKRVKEIDADAILESGYIEQFIEDHHISIFATIGNSEKPDIIAAKLLEGRVAIFCDGTPFVLTVPFLFIENLQTGEDYYIRPTIAMMLRMLRITSLFITMVTPAFYVAVTVFHYEMLPTVLFITTAASREGIPFPPVLEALLMGGVFEIMKEAGVRMPRPVGQAISIVGALVLGESAVNAGIVSSEMVIFIAITGITDFVNPSLVSVTFYIRIFLLLLAAGLGLYGVLIGFFFILAHMCSLRSFGTPYLSPIAPVIWRELKDTAVRGFLWGMKARPQSITWKKTQRQESRLKTDTVKPKRR